MAERSMIFAAPEFRARTARLQRAMARDGFDVLLLTQPADIFYVTGFLTRFWESPARAWFVIVPGSGEPVAVIPAIGADLMGRCWISDIRTWAAPDPRDDGISLLAASLRETLPGTGRIGVAMAAETHLRMPLADFARLRERLAPHRFVDGTKALHSVREIKSEAEIDKIRATCLLADRAFARVPEFVRPGAALGDVFRRFQIALLQEGADWVSYVAGGAGQGGYGDVISPAGPDPIMPGDLVMLDTGAVRDGYFCDFDRNFSIGPASDALRWAHDVLFAATERALVRLRPAMTAAQAHAVMAEAIVQAGAMPLGGRLGHGLGVTLTEWPSFTPLDHTELREGMVLTLEPGLQIAPGKIMVHEENIVLRADGPELLSPRAPATLPEIRL